MPILDERNFEFFSRSPDQTRRLGIHMGNRLKPGDIICLEGNLGAGKTTLVQGIGQGWGTLDQVTSPSYVLINEYSRPKADLLFHIDAYRLESTFDTQELDFDRMLQQGPLVIEWAERIKAVLPWENLWIRLSFSADEHRTMLLTPHGKRYEALVEQLRRKIYGAF